MITPPLKKKIQDIVSVFETSSTKPRYDVLVTLNDGPGQRKQITYGKHQTTEYGNLGALLRMYCTSYGRYAREFQPYLPIIGVKPLADNSSFKYLLKMAGTDDMMAEVQDKFFDQYYWTPALQFFQSQGFTLPLAMLVIYDSYIQSGCIMEKLRSRFAALPPAKRGEEKTWISQYVTVRDQFLEHNANPVVRGSDYRTDCLLDQIAAGNWDLSAPVCCKFNSAREKDWITVS